MALNGYAPMALKLLTLDIESAPNVAHVWGLFKQTVSLNQLMESGQVISFAAKWHGKPKVLFYSDHHDGHDVMIQPHMTSCRRRTR